MSLPLFSNLAFFALATLAMIIGACGTSNGTYLVESTQREKVYRKPLSLRIGAAVLGLAVLQLPLGVPLIFPAGVWVMTTLALALCLLVGRMLLLVSLPDELRLDFVDRTFQRRRGWHPFASAWSGPVSSLRCIYITELSSTTGSSTYAVGVRGARMGGQMKLGNFTALAPAQHFADELISVTDLPLMSSVKRRKYALQPVAKKQSRSNRA